MIRNILPRIYEIWKFPDNIRTQNFRFAPPSLIGRLLRNHARGQNWLAERPRQFLGWLMEAHAWSLGFTRFLRRVIVLRVAGFGLDLGWGGREPEAAA